MAILPFFADRVRLGELQGICHRRLRRSCAHRWRKFGNRHNIRADGTAGRTRSGLFGCARPTVPRRGAVRSHRRHGLLPEGPECALCGGERRAGPALRPPGEGRPRRANGARDFSRPAGRTLRKSGPARLARGDFDQRTIGAASLSRWTAGLVPDLEGAAVRSDTARSWAYLASPATRRAARNPIWPRCLRCSAISTTISILRCGFPISRRERGFRHSSSISASAPCSGFPPDST